MTKEEIIQMAREAGYGEAMADLHGPALERFAALTASRVAAAAKAEEREACAKVCDVTIVGDEYATALINSYADKIRARGESI